MMAQTGRFILLHNSGLPAFNDLDSIAIDGLGNKWIGTNGGLAVYKEGGVVTSVKGNSK